MEYVIIKNNKAPVKSIFESIEAPELRNPNEKQKYMLTGICDGVEFLTYDAFNMPSIKTIIQSKMKAGDYLYSIRSNGTLNLEGIHNGKKSDSMEKPNIDLDRILKLYEKIVQIEQFYIPTIGWISMLPDGTDIRNGDLYYELIPNATSRHEISPDIRERLVQRCIDAGATMIQFKCTDKEDEYCYPDYKVSELQYMLFDMDKILHEGTKSAEVFELQRILKVTEDGIFGKQTLEGVRSKFHKDKTSLNDFRIWGYEVRTQIPISRLWFLNKS